MVPFSIVKILPAGSQLEYQKHARRRRGVVRGRRGAGDGFDGWAGAVYTEVRTTTTLTRKHQITLPAAIVQALELAPGSHR